MGIEDKFGRGCEELVYVAIGRAAFDCFYQHVLATQMGALFASHSTAHTDHIRIEVTQFAKAEDANSA